MTSTIALALVAATLSSAPDSPETHGVHLRARVPFANNSMIDNGPLATPRPYAEGRVDDTRRPGFNGRLWVGETFTHSAPAVWAADWPEPGPTKYGAPQNYAPTMYARVGTLAIGLSPWTRLEGEGLAHLEDARVYWLRQNNYSGGVRTHVNPGVVNAIVYGVEPKAQEIGEITPAATIQIRPEAPRQSGTKRRVDAGSLEGATRISLPGNIMNSGVVRLVSSK